MGQRDHHREEEELLSRRQGEQILTALEKAGITRASASRITDDKRYARSIVSMLESGSSNVFTDKEYLRAMYGPQFSGIKSPEEQVDVLVQAFQCRGTSLNPGNVLKVLKESRFGSFKPGGPEGVLILLKLSFVISWGGGDYCKGSRYIQYIAENTLDFVKWNIEPVNTFDPQHVRLNEKTEASLRKIDAMFEGNLVAMPFQFGASYRSCPNHIVDARLAYNEFKLPVYAGACSLITHPDRIQIKGCASRDTLHLGCPGDEFSPDADGTHAHYCFYYIEREGGYCADIGSRSDDDEDLDRFAPMTGWLESIRS